MQQVLRNKRSHPLSFYKAHCEIQFLTYLVQLPPTSVITGSQQNWMFKCLHSKSCYYPLEFSNLSTFAFKNSMNMRLLVKPDILPHGEEGSERDKDFFMSFFFLFDFLAF